MPAKETLVELKSKMPYKYTYSIILSYKKRHGIDIYGWTTMRFFKEYSYNKKPHNTIKNAAFTQQKFKNKTNSPTEGHLYKVSILQYCREQKGPIQ